MRTPSWRVGAWTSCVFAVAGLQVAVAGLPALSEGPLLGYFAVMTNKHYQFGISDQGEITVAPMSNKTETVAKDKVVPIVVVIEEVLPDGKTTVKQIAKDSLASTQGATDKLTNAVITGKVTGGATFELSVENQRGLILLGGRVTNPGTLTKNPLRLGLRIKFPKFYEKETKTEKKDVKAFEKKTSDDRLDLKWTDGKRKKQTFEKSVIANNKELNGPGIAAISAEISVYKGEKFLFTASENSSMALSNETSAPLYEGFTVTWVPDVAKDPDGKARLAIEVK